MTHKQRWLTIGKAYLTEYEERTEEQKELTCFGFCCSLDSPFFAMLISCERKEQEVKTLKSICRRFTDKNGYLFPYRGVGVALNTTTFRPIHDTWRGMLALLFAAMTEKEFRRLGE